MEHPFEIYRDPAGEYRFRLRAAHGETVLSSEPHDARSSALDAIEAVRRSAAKRSRFLRVDGGYYRFLLEAPELGVLAKSAGYESSARREQGIDVVSRAASEAQVVDLTLGA